MVDSVIIRMCWSCIGSMGESIDDYRSLVSNAVLSYTLGLRHAFDADHISVPPAI